MQIANIMEEQNRLNEAFHYVQVASETYTQIYGISSENTIIANWLKLQIMYAQNNKNSGESVVDLAEGLYNSLVLRKKNQREKFYNQN